MHVPQEIHVLYLFMAKCHVYIRKEYFVTWPTATAAWATIHSELVREAMLRPETTVENRPRERSHAVLGHAFSFGFTEGVPSCTWGHWAADTCLPQKELGNRRWDKSFRTFPCLHTPKPPSLVP